MKKITAIISKDGKIKMETSGFSGSACEAETRDIERALGTVTSNKHTAEFNAPVTVKQTV